jgi:hypothetical protein
VVHNGELRDFLMESFSRSTSTPVPIARLRVRMVSIARECLNGIFSDENQLQTERSFIWMGNVGSRLCFPKFQRGLPKTPIFLPSSFTCLSLSNSLNSKFAQSKVRQPFRNRFPSRRRHLFQTLAYAFSWWVSCGSTSEAASSNNNVNSK